MTFNNQQAAPFWEFIRTMQNSGAGVDHPAQHFHAWGTPEEGARGAQPGGGAFPFGGPFAFGRFGPGARGRRGGRRDGSRSRSRSPRRDGDGAHPDGEGGAPQHHGRRGHGRRGGGGWGGPPHGHGGCAPPPPPFAGAGGLSDLSALFESLSTHPLAQAFRGSNPTEASPADADADDMDNAFVPPIDVFTTDKTYVLHVALPGAQKEDVGVHWDAEKGQLTVAGVVYRPGDEKFLASLSRSERKVGAFERSVKLPLRPEDKEEIDGDHITAKLENGVLVVTVPKVEKEESWTEIKRVEIE